LVRGARTLPHPLALEEKLACMSLGDLPTSTHLALALVLSFSMSSFLREASLLVKSPPGGGR
jgi:hypothetical protein